MKNNNPGNIRITGIKWQGEVPLLQNTDGTFEQFVEYRWGVRAMIKIIQNYKQQGINSLSGIILRWAPLFENPSFVYIDFVTEQTGISAYIDFDFSKESLRKIVIAMTEFENGMPAMTIRDFNNAWDIL